MGFENLWAQIAVTWEFWMVAFLGKVSLRDLFKGESCDLQIGQVHMEAARGWPYKPPKFRELESNFRGENRENPDVFLFFENWGSEQLPVPGWHFFFLRNFQSTIHLRIQRLKANKIFRFHWFHGHHWLPEWIHQAKPCLGARYSLRLLQMPGGPNGER